MPESGGSVEFPEDGLEVSATGLTLGDYRDAVNGIGPLAFQWADKPHRLVYDLINEVKRLSRFPVAHVPTDGRLDYCVVCGESWPCSHSGRSDE